MESCFAPFTLDQIERVIRVFNTGPIQSRVALEEALGREYLVKEAMKQQLILPVNFWAPNEFTSTSTCVPFARVLLDA
ncbi:MAG: hypothetical protein IPN01_36130 [Deltaproteobacteria bacterium]|nr:hypothetical protein [Deltaproteobacteria bacterium]